MELKVPYSKLDISSSDYISDPEEKDISDDEDDDRNHKHRRRDTRSQSLERDTRDQVFRSYGKRSKPFENGRSFRENESSIEKDIPGKFDKRRLGMAAGIRVAGDFNQRIRSNQMFTGDLSSGRGRGRESGTWNQFDSRFSPVDIASQIVHRGSFPPNLFAGRGVPNVSAAQTAPWSAFGLIPGIPNSGLDTMQSIGLQGTLRPPINPPLNIGMPRQRCRDFEERGFCLRGDMCPMEHGINRIVIEDVQSLSQFNLPLSLPNAHLMGKSTGSLPAVTSSSTTILTGKGLLGKSSKPGVGDDSMCFNGVYSGSPCVPEADLYDPDQPLWNNNRLDKPNALSAMHSSKLDDSESLINDDPSSQHHIRKGDRADNGCPSRNATASASQINNLSVWGRVGSRNGQDVKGKIDPVVSSSGYLENEMKEPNEVLTSVQANSYQQKHNVTEDAHTKAGDLSIKAQNDTMRNMRKPSQKATRTLFVNGIPQHSNKKETLLSHFQKFGEVIDVYIPANSQRAFVQFLKREEAEAALKSPDAVLGNRFIKLWWANRDSIPDDGVSSGTSMHIAPRHITAASLPSLAIKGKNSGQVPTSKCSVSHSSDSSLATSDHTNAFNSPKVPPPLQKKLETLEQLKEELRKKQEMLDMKRNNFRRQLDKLEKQATGNKADVVPELTAKRLKVGITTDAAKAISPKACDSGIDLASPDTNVNGVNVKCPCPEPTTSMLQQESSKLEEPAHSLDPVGTHVHFDRDKVDGCSTGFRIIPPLPAEFSNVDIMKEHFSSFGDCTAELDSEDGGCAPIAGSTNCSANVTFLTRDSAERAFVDGKCWHGQDLKFIWLSSAEDPSDGREHSSSTLEASPDADMETASEPESMVFKETPRDEEPETSTRDNGIALLKTGKVSPARESESS